MSQIPPKKQNSRRKRPGIPCHRPIIPLPAKQPHIDLTYKASVRHFGEVATNYSFTSRKTSTTGPLFPPNRLATAQ